MDKERLELSEVMTTHKNEEQIFRQKCEQRDYLLETNQLLRDQILRL